MLTITSTGMPTAAVTAMAATRGGDFDVLKSAPGVRERLRDEQANRCAYCERIMSQEPGRTKIEHFHPRTKDFTDPRCASESGTTDREKSIVEWRNLLLVCPGNSGREKTCDTRKGATDICTKIHNPKRDGLNSPTQVMCNYEGRVTSVEGTDEAKDAIDNDLNLNERTLLLARKALWASLIGEVRRARSPNPRGLNKADLRHRLVAASQTKEFGSVYLTLAARLQ
ncbi:hypothetical protein AAEX63_12850 [Luteococcus sp. H138]|uniref:hypothetical protein n=1 Tax=unclassified Luteococcus TaxID=2639923 RepID=UPI00313DAF8F